MHKMEHPLVGISGSMGSGKNTLAPLLMKYFYPGTSADYLAFADNLKVEVEVLISLKNRGMSYDDMIDEIRIHKAPDFPWEEHENLLRNIVDSVFQAETRKKDANYRRLLQLWGTDVRRKQNADYWIQSIREWIGEELGTPFSNSACVTDVRFPNEADFIHDMGGIVVRVNATISTRVKRIRERDGYTPSLSELTHDSELPVAYDYALDNDVTRDINVNDIGWVKKTMRETGTEDAIRDMQSVRTNTDTTLSNTNMINMMRFC